MYNDYGYTSSFESASLGLGSIIWVILSVIIALVGGILIYLFFVKKDTKVEGKLKTLKDFLSFKIMLIEPILKVCYLVCTLLVVLSSFALIRTSFISFLLTLIMGPVLIRIVYESALLKIMIWKNTNILANTNNKKEKVKEENNNVKK